MLRPFLDLLQVNTVVGLRRTATVNSVMQLGKERSAGLAKIPQPPSRRLHNRGFRFDLISMLGFLVADEAHPHWDLELAYRILLLFAILFLPWPSEETHHSELAAS